MSYGILLIRVVLGLTLMGHGAQKLFGVFGGMGLRGTGSFFASLGYRATPVMVTAACFCSFGGGLLLALGFLTPVGALGIAILMVNAIGTVQGKHGFWARDGGYESNLLIWVVAVGLAATGGGRFSVDRLLGWSGSLSGPWWGLAIAVGSLAVGSITLTLGRTSEVATEKPELIDDEVSPTSQLA